MQKAFKRVFSLFLSIVLVLSTFAATGIQSFAAGNVATSKSGAYLMAYFTGQGAGEKIHFATSKDGYNFEPLNGNKAIIDPVGSGVTGHVRDPYVFRGQDGWFYILGADIDAEKSEQNHTIFCWRSKDLISWDFHNLIDIGAQIADTTRAWAPQAIWDANHKNDDGTTGAYMMYWANQTTNAGGVVSATTLYYSYTKDFKTFSAPQSLYAPENEKSAIDGDIVYDALHNVYYLYFKDEQTSVIMMAESLSSVNGPYSNPKPAIGKELLPQNEPENQALEGCQMYNINGTSTWLLIADKYKGDTKFLMFSTDNFNTFKAVDEADYTINNCNPRHGSIMQITDAEYDALNAAYGKRTSTQSGLRSGEHVLDLMMCRYFADYGNTTTDSSGNHYELEKTNKIAMTVENDIVGAKFTSNDATTTKNTDNGSYAYISTKKMFSENAANLKDGITISFRSKGVDSGTIHYFDAMNAPKFGDITKGTLGIGSTYSKYDDFFLQTNGLFEALKKGKEYSTKNSTSMSTGEWHNYAISMSNGYIMLSVDGKKVSEITNSAIDAEWFNNVFASDTSKLGLGISAWSGDKLLDGTIGDFCIFSRALTPKEVEAAMDELLDAPEENILSTNIKQMFFDNCGSDSGTGYAAEYLDTASDTAYGDKVVVDDTYGKVLATNGQSVTAYKQFNNSTKYENGYTMSFTVNPGADLGNDPIISLGSLLSVSETGDLKYSYGTSTYAASNIFADKLTKNEWHNVTIQFVPNFTFERIYVYVDSELTATIDTFKGIPEGSAYPEISIITGAFQSGSQVVTYGPSDCKLNNVRIYAGCVNKVDLYNQELNLYAAKIIKQNIEDFKQLVQTWHVDPSDPSKNVILPNIGEGYAAYDAAQRYLDSITYGDTVAKPEMFEKLASDLRAAMDKMKPENYKALTANGKCVYGPSDTDCATADKKAYSGLLYNADLGENADSNPSPVMHIQPGNDIHVSVDTRVGYDNTVFLYDGTGTELKMPVYTATKSNGNNTVAQSGFYNKLTTFYPTTVPYQTDNFKNSDGSYNIKLDPSGDEPVAGAAATSKVFTLEGKTGESSSSGNARWHGYSEDGEVNFADINASKSGMGCTRENTQRYVSDRLSYQLNTNKTVFYYNILQFHPEEAIKGDGYYGHTPVEYIDKDGKSFDGSRLIGKSRLAGKYNISWGVSFVSANRPQDYNWDGATRVNFLNPNSAVYVVDSSKVYELLNDAKMAENIHNLFNYTSESAQQYCDAIDAFTSLDPTQYNIADGVESAVNHMQSDIDMAVDAYETAKALHSDNEILVPIGNYTNLKKHMENTDYINTYNGTGKLEDGTDVDRNKFTDDSLADFDNCYESIRRHFTNMNPELGKDAQDYLAQDSLVNIASGRLDVMYERLMERIDYTELRNNRDAYGKETLTVNNVNEETGELETEQQFTISTWVPYNDTVTLANGVLDNNVMVNGHPLSYEKDGKTVVLNDENGDVLQFGATNTPKYKYKEKVFTAGTQGGTQTYWVVDETNPSKQAVVVDDSTQMMYKANDKLEPVAAQDCYDAYNAAQAQAQKLDYDAYLNKAEAVKNNLQKGYVIDGTNKFAKDFDINDTSSVYVRYNGDIYKNVSGNAKLDAITSGVVTTYNIETSNANLRKYEVTYKIITDGGEPEIVKDRELRSYGDIVTLEYTGAGKVLAWKVEQGGRETYINNVSAQYNVKIQEDSEITVYVTTDAKATYAVEVRDYFNRAKVVFVQEGTTATFDGLTVKFSDGQTVTAQDCSYMTQSIWYVNNASVDAGGTITIDKDTVIKATGVRIDGKMTYNFVGGKFADGSASAEYGIDEKVVATADDAADFIGIAMKTIHGYTMLTYEKTYTFYAYPVSKQFENSTVELVAVTGSNISEYFSESAKADVENQLPMSYGVGLVKDGNFSLFCNITGGLKENPETDKVQIVERGVLYSPTAMTADQMLKGADGVKTARSSSDIQKVQYMITKKGALNTACMRSYVAYLEKVENPEYITQKDKDEFIWVPKVAYGPVINYADCL